MKFTSKVLLTSLVVFIRSTYLEKNVVSDTAPKTASWRDRFAPIVAHAKRISALWSSARVGTFGASIAYYTIFSIAPLLVIAISVAGIFLDRTAAQTAVIDQFNATFGPRGGEFIESLIRARATEGADIVLSIVGFVVLLIGAAGIFSQLQTALNTIFENLPDKTVRRGVWLFIRQKLLSFGMVLSIGFLLLVSLALSALLTAFGGALSRMMPQAVVVGHIIDFVVSFALISVFLALTYKVLPSKRLAWRPALIGGAITGAFFMVSKLLLGLYLGSSTAFTGYGAASALVLFVLWFYYMSQVFLFGAIVVRLYVVPSVDGEKRGN